MAEASESVSSAGDKSPQHPRAEAQTFGEVHDEFEAAQREGRPMRAEWSWERQARWEGPLP